MISLKPAVRIVGIASALAGLLFAMPRVAPALSYSPLLQTPSNTWSVSSTDTSDPLVTDAHGGGNVTVHNNGPGNVKVKKKHNGATTTITIEAGDSSTVGYANGDDVEVDYDPPNSASGTYTF